MSGRNVKALRRTALRMKRHIAGVFGGGCCRGGAVMTHAERAAARYKEKYPSTVFDAACFRREIDMLAAIEETRDEPAKETESAKAIRRTEMTHEEMVAAIIIQGKRTRVLENMIRMEQDMRDHRVPEPKPEPVPTIKIESSSLRADGLTADLVLDLSACVPGQKYLLEIPNEVFEPKKKVVPKPVSGDQLNREGWGRSLNETLAGDGLGIYRISEVEEACK